MIQFDLEVTHCLEKPADSSITTAADDFETGNVFEHLKSG